MDEKRKAARWRKRRIIYNNDGDDIIEAKTPHDVKAGLMTRSDGELIDAFLRARTTPLVETQVDSIWYATCMSGLTFTHHTELGGFHAKGIPQELIDTYGRDNLQIQLEFCREHDREGFWSLRMNDTHDSWPGGSNYLVDGLAPFKRDHPEFLFGEPGDREKDPEKKDWSSIDFSHAEVRDHIFSLIQEVCQGHDVDGVELDFLRSPKYFAPTADGLAVEEQHLEAMTDLVRRVSSMAEKTGRHRERPLLLAVRTPFSVEDSRFVGLDIERWLQEGLVDIWVAGGLQESIMTESFRRIVDLGHRYDVPVYPCIDWGFWQHWAFLDIGAGKHRTRELWIQALRSENTPFFVALNSWEGTVAAWRGAAMNLWDANPDGIYIFNGFHGTSIDTFRELGDLGSMANKDKIFGVDQFAGDSSFKDVREVELQQGEPVSIVFQVGEDIKSGNTAELQFRLHFWDLEPHDDIAVKLNDASLDDLIPSGPEQKTSTEQWLECRLNPAQVTRGDNRVELVVRKRDESASAPLILDSVQLRVRYKG